MSKHRRLSWIIESKYPRLCAFTTRVAASNTVALASIVALRLLFAATFPIIVVALATIVALYLLVVVACPITIDLAIAVALGALCAVAVRASSVAAASRRVYYSLWAD